MKVVLFIGSLFMCCIHANAQTAIKPAGEDKNVLLGQMVQPAGNDPINYNNLSLNERQQGTQTTNIAAQQVQPVGSDPVNLDALNADNRKDQGRSHPEKKSNTAK